MATTSKLLTYEEWLKMPEAEGVEEVVNGEIQRMPPIKFSMQTLSKTWPIFSGHNSTAGLFKSASAPSGS